MPQPVVTFLSSTTSLFNETIEARDFKGYTPPQYAMSFDFNLACMSVLGALHASVARLLIEHGASLAMKAADDGKNALHALMRSFPVVTTDDDRCEEAQLVSLMTTGRGVGVNDVENAGNTALDLAAGPCPKPAAVLSMLQQGAVVHVLNEAGDSPLHAAARMDTSLKGEGLTLKDAIETQDEVMRLILEAAGNEGELMGKPNASGQTPRALQDESRMRLKEGGARHESVYNRGL